MAHSLQQSDRRCLVRFLVASFRVWRWSGWQRLLVLAQPESRAQTNPLAGDAKAIQQGRNIFRGRCAVCHGIDAKGYRGTDLTSGEWAHGGADAEVFSTISRGVPGTEMPARGNLSDDEIWMLIAYLRTLATGTPVPERGDARRGEELFWDARPATADSAT